MTAPVGLRAVARRLRWAPAHLRSAFWAWRELRRLRRQLPSTGTAAVVRPPPAGLPWSSGRSVVRVAGLRRATCLERSLLRQAWLRERGQPRDLVIGVRRGEDVEAHAWLDGDADAAGYTELHRIPARPDQR